MNLSEDDLSKFCEENNFPKFHSSQILNWIYKKYAITFEEMSDIPKSLRVSLEENYFIHNSKVETMTEDEYGTKKLLISLYDKKKNRIRNFRQKRQNHILFILSSRMRIRLRFLFYGSYGTFKKFDGG